MRATGSSARRPTPAHDPGAAAQTGRPMIAAGRAAEPHGPCEPGSGFREWLMEFLVRIEVDWPPDVDPDEFARLTSAERARARELGAEGRIRRLWRIPGRWANWGIWEAEDATA